MHPQRLGRYELLRHLASGGMARIYIARVTGTGGFARHVVIKTLPDECRHDAEQIAMFLDEARLMAALHHQHIAQVFEIGHEEDGTHFLAMEYVHGETVRRVLETTTKRRIPLPLDFGLSVTCATAAGLHHAHERRGLDGAPLGIVHRDVSPSNVLLGYDGSIKLIDFGIAKAHQRVTQTLAGFVKGKAGYMAPEQVRGESVDRRSDVFALGVLAYELTTQTRAFQGPSELETMRRTIHGEIDPPSKRVPNYPPALEDVVMTALANDPADRFQDANAMRLSLEQVARELGLTLGDEPVIRALESLFPPRPEPWFVDGESAIDDDDDHDAAASMSMSEPSIEVVSSPHSSSRMRFARGSQMESSVDLPQGLASPSASMELAVDVTTLPFERAAQHAVDASGSMSMAITIPVSRVRFRRPPQAVSISVPIKSATFIDDAEPTLRDPVEPVKVFTTPEHDRATHLIAVPGRVRRPIAVIAIMAAFAICAALLATLLSSRS